MTEQSEQSEQSGSDGESLHELTVEDDFAGEGGAGGAEGGVGGVEGGPGGADSGNPQEPMPGYGSDSGFDTDDASAGGVAPEPDPQGDAGVPDAVGGPVDTAGGEVSGAVPGAANSEYSEDSTEV